MIREYASPKARRSYRWRVASPRSCERSVLLVRHFLADQNETDRNCISDDLINVLLFQDATHLGLAGVRGLARERHLNLGFARERHSNLQVGYSRLGVRWALV